MRINKLNDRYTNLPIFILAYNAQQADFCAKFVLKIREKHKYCFVSNESSIMGHRDKVLYLYGTWFRRHDSDILLQTARAREFRIIELEDNR